AEHSVQDGKIEIKISNTGAHIQEKDIPFIFDPFFRGSNSRREKGTGLGLSIVKSIIESHGWSISVSTENQLTTFVIVIPHN
ncbi:MAG: sensor histidine kinase, partial [Spirochaetaceae bacterium]|nr:sensor histidine kinase [Spirochaetaceae bacterium]